MNLRVVVRLVTLLSLGGCGAPSVETGAPPARPPAQAGPATPQPSEGPREDSGEEGFAADTAEDTRMAAGVPAPPEVDAAGEADVDPPSDATSGSECVARRDCVAAVTACRGRCVSHLCVSQEDTSSLPRDHVRPARHPDWCRCIDGQCRAHEEIEDPFSR